MEGPTLPAQVAEEIGAAVMQNTDSQSPLAANANNGSQAVQEVGHHPFRNRAASPSRAEPLAFLRSMSGGLEFPLIFEPDDLYKSKEDDVAVDRFVHFCNVLKSLMMAGSVFVFGAVLLLLMALFPDEFEKWYAASFLTVWTVYAIAILKVVQPRKGHYIYRIITSTSIPPKYPRISMAAKQYIWMNQPIDSLSELCHVEGATTTVGFTWCTSLAWISILFFLMIMRFRRSCEFEFQFTDASMYLAGFCMYGVQLFKYDALHRTMLNLHLICVFLGTLCVTIAVMSQQISLGGYRWIIPTVIAIFGSICCYLALIHYGQKERKRVARKYKKILANQMTDDIRKEISQLSRKIIWWEVTSVMCTALVIALWMWHYDQPCAYGCVGPFKEECQSTN